MTDQEEDMTGEDLGQDTEIWRAKFDLILLSNCVPSCRSTDTIRKLKKAPDS